VIFSAEADSPAWWARFLRPGFRHVYAVSYFADQERWVCVDPARNRLMVELFTAEQAPRVLARMMETAGAVLRVASRRDRLNAPAFGFCGGAMKALLGIRSWALTPRGLYRDLLRARCRDCAHGSAVRCCGRGGRRTFRPMSGITDLFGGDGILQRHAAARPLARIAIRPIRAERCRQAGRGRATAHRGAADRLDPAPVAARDRVELARLRPALAVRLARPAAQLAPREWLKWPIPSCSSPR
jgi:hypothetical protein